MNFIENAHAVIKHLNRYYTDCHQKKEPAIRQQAIDTIHEELNLERLIRTGGLEGDHLERFLKSYLTNTTRLHHPGYMAHQVGIPHPTGALGSLIDGFTNNAMAIYEMGPAAAAVEFFMINYLLKKVGWTPMPTRIEDRLTFAHAAGVLTHGGSLANMTALLAARNHLDKTIRENGVSRDLVVLAPQASHYSIAKACGVIGIGENNVLPLQTDPCGRVVLEQVRPAIQAAKAHGKRIVALTVNACSTGTGLYDPIDEIADICREENIWFHIDGAHGASAIFSQKYRNRLKGIEKADSLIIDAHKMLRTPTVCAALLVKNGYHLDHTFEHNASYLFHEKKQPGFDFIGQVIECTKSGMGLKFFMAFAAMGEEKMTAYIDNCCDLAVQAHDFIVSQPDFSVPCRPESNILCFRTDGPDSEQIAIRDRLIDSGRFYISSTELDGRRYLRIVIINPETDMTDIRSLIAAIRESR